MFHQIFIPAFQSAIANVIEYAVIAFVSTILLLVLRLQNKNSVKYVEYAVQLAKVALAPVLGPKTDAIFNYWLKGMNAILQGSYNQDTAASQLVAFIQSSANEDGITLTALEIVGIADAAHIFVRMVGIKTGPATTAVHNMSVGKPTIK